MVKTRTVVQTRTHAQKYFQKLAKNNGVDTFSIDDGIGEPVLMSAEKTSEKKSARKSKRIQASGHSPVPSGAQDDEHGGQQMLMDYEEDAADSPPGTNQLHQVGRSGSHHSQHNQHHQSYYPLDSADLAPNMPIPTSPAPQHTAISQLSYAAANLHKQQAMFQHSNAGDLTLHIPHSNNSNNSNSNNFNTQSGYTQSQFPQPSPAACGKRKHAELKAAQILVSSSSQSNNNHNNNNDNNNNNLDDVDMLQQMRSDEGLRAKQNNNNHQNGSISLGTSTVSAIFGTTNASLAHTSNNSQKLKRIRPAGLHLSILNPADTLFLSADDDTNPDPGTPWNAQIKSLQHQQSTLHHLPAPTTMSIPLLSTTHSQSQQSISLQNLHSNIDSSATAPPLSLGLSIVSIHGFTQQLIHRVQAHLHNGDLLGLQQLFAEQLHQSNGSSVQLLKSCEEPLLADAMQLDGSLADESQVFGLIKLLLDHGAQSGLVDSAGNTALHYAAQQGNVHVGRLLVTKGCPLNAVNLAGDAAVHLAAIAGHGAVLEMLASYGANFHLRNAQALSPMDLAGYASKDPGEREVLRRLMLSSETRLRTAVLYHPDFLSHSPRQPSDWEGPDRLSSIMTRLRDRKEFPAYELEVSDAFDKADVALLGRVHSADYLSFVNALSKQVQLLDQQQLQLGNHQHQHVALPFTPQVQKHLLHRGDESLKNSEYCDTSFSAGTLNAARRAAGAVAHAVDLVLLGRNRNVFCAVRPPGHHAGYRGLLNSADSCGFCIFNNVAAGAMHALEDHKCQRVAIIDLDIHHGNGTEDIVRTVNMSNRLFFFSVHLYDRDPSIAYHFYPGTGDRNDLVSVSSLVNYSNCILIYTDCSIFIYIYIYIYRCIIL
jgi:acetoin utilization deacetylase AcuC-like enzyme